MGVLEMRRHYKNYFRGIEDIRPVRERLVLEPEASGILAILQELAETKYFQPDLALA